jgi:thymidylate kinase
MRSGHLLAIELCRFLEEEHVDYVLVGDACTPRLGSAQRIELAIAPDVLPELPLILHKFCHRNECKLVTCVREQRQTWRCLVSSVNREGRPEFVALEIFGDFVRRGRLLLSASELLAQRHVEGGELRLRPPFFIAAPAIEFVYYLLRCVYEGELREEQGQHLRDCWQRDPSGAAAQVARFWDLNREGGVIERAADGNDWSAVRELLPSLRAGVRRRRRLRIIDWLYELRERVRAHLRPSGLLLACLGPQGIGKANVITALKDRPLAPFISVHTMELRPRIFRPQTKDLPAGQRKQHPRGRIATIAKLMMFAVDYWFGYCCQIRPRLVRAMLVVSNRYYDDVLVDPLRYRMARPFAFARALLPWIPRPDLWLVFDAPAELIRSRSNALTEEESSRQRGEYRRLLRGYENVVVLDARQQLDKIVAEAERAIVAHLENRTAEWLHLPLAAPKNPLSTRALLFFCRRRIPLLSRLVRILFNSDIHCRLPAYIYMPHPYGIVMHSQAAIGERVTVMQQVAIGDKDQGESVAPVIGNDVYIGAGARVLGDVRIGDGVTIGANAVVTKDIPPGVTVVGANRIVDASTTPATSRSVTPFPVGIQRGA